MSIPADLKYTKDHEWLRSDGPTAMIGITHHAQDQLGDVVFVELPEVGSTITAGESFGTVESVKAVSDLIAPVTGEVVEINATLSDAPETVNQDPYGDGWMLKVKPTRAADIEALLSPSDYEKVVAAAG